MSSSALRRLAYTALCILLLAPAPARAWLSPGHMATGAIAYDSLDHRDPAAVTVIVGLEAAHPDHARFERLLVDAQGDARRRKLFELMARWPDDARGGPYDHPSWHYSEKIQSSLRYVLPFTWGRARSAFLHELTTARDVRAPATERAVALCWVLHIVGDMHEPEHAGLWMDRQFPFTDRAGNTAWIRTMPEMRPEKLHWFWDSAGATDSDDARRRDADAFAARIEAEHADPAIMPPQDAARAFDTWAGESRTVSRMMVYRKGALPLGASATTATLLPPGYVQQAQSVAEDRLALAGYRIAALLEGLR